jgi:hypothetical protein
MRLHTAASALALSATLLVAEGALGCADMPSRWLHWSYPDATTEVVPPDAVFRAFAYPQRLVRFELDGVSLPSTAEKQRNTAPTPAEDLNRYDNGVPFEERYEDPFGTSEFVPPEPLALGQHEVVIRVSDLRESLPPDMQETYRFHFRVEALAEATAEPSIAHVTSYSWKDDSNGAPVGFFPPECPGIIDIAHVYCDDTDYGRSSTFVELQPGAPDGALGYFVGNALVPLGCSTLYRRTGDGSAASRTNRMHDGGPIQVEAILPSGLGAPRSFEGEIAVVSGMGEPRVYAEPAPWGCSMTSTRNDRLAAWAGPILLALIALTQQRRRGRGRQ